MGALQNHEQRIARPTGLAGNTCDGGDLHCPLRADLMSARGEGETYFERFCEQHCIRFKHVRESAKGKRPDYWVRCGGGACIVEVKDLESNARESVFQKELEAKGYAFHGSIPGKRMRGRLKKAAMKYAHIKKRSIPCITFVFNNTKITSSTSSLNIYAAMFGDLSFSFSIDGSGSEALVIAENGVIRPERNTSTSAVAVMQWTYATGYTARLYHNPYAVCPLAVSNVAAMPGIEQFRVCKPGEDGMGFWTAIDLARL